MSGRVRKGPVANALDRASSEQRAQIKTNAFVNAAAQLPKTFLYNGVQITITSGPTVIHGALAVTISATYNGQPIPTDNPYLFYNPPIMVQDGATREDFKEDLIAAYQEFVGSVVVHVAQRLGWRS